MAKIKFNIKEIWSFTKEMFSSFSDDNVMSRSAALAYYTTFSLAPILVIAITVAGFFFGKEAMEGEVFAQLRGLMGDAAASQIQQMMASTSRSGAGPVATIISIATLIFGATGVFGELKYSLNRIWDVKAKPKSGVWNLVRERLLSFAMVLSIGFILLVTLILNGALALIGTWIASLLPEAGEVALQVFNLLLSLAVSALLFAVIFKALPDVKIKYADVWKGGLFTAILFTVGKWLIGLYIGQSDVGGTYGAAGSLVVILLWVYYSAVILFLGAEFTYVYAQRYGAHIVPTENAVHIVEVEQPEGTAVGKGPAAGASTGQEKGQPPHRPYSYAPEYASGEK